MGVAQQAFELVTAVARATFAQHEGPVERGSDRTRSQGLVYEGSLGLLDGRLEVEPSSVGYQGPERVERTDVSVCTDPPPFDVDIWVDGSLATLFEVWLGTQEFNVVIDEGRLRVRALPWQERDFTTWFSRSPGVPLVHEELAKIRAQPAFN